MKLRDLSRYDIVEMAWKALPNCEEGDVIVVVDIRNGNIEVLFKTEEFENWAKNFEHKQAILHLKEEAANHDVGFLYKKHKYEVCCRILEIMEKTHILYKMWVKRKGGF